MKKTIKIISLIMATVCFLTFSLSAYGAGYSAKGIDVSYWNTYPNGVKNEIDFAKVKAQGVKFVILRIGTSYGIDSTFESNYTRAKAAGLDVGCYFYTYSKTAEATYEDAKKVVGWIGDKKMEYPVYFDIEDQTLEGLTKKVKMELCETFINYIKQAGFLPGLYCNYNWLVYHLDGEYCKNNYEIWLARWNNSGQPDVDRSGECRVWQYTASGRVDGIVGSVDLDVSYYDYPTYVKENGLNNYPKNETETESPSDLFSDQIKLLTRIIVNLMTIIITLAKLLGA